MNIEQDLRDALRRKAAPPDLADRVMARIERAEAAHEAVSSSGSDTGRVLRMSILGGSAEARHRRASWLAAAAAAVLVATGATQYYAYRATAAEAERVQQDIQVALRITSEKLALVQEKIERTTQDSAR